MFKKNLFKKTISDFRLQLPKLGLILFVLFFVISFFSPIQLSTQSNAKLSFSDQSQNTSAQENFEISDIFKPVKVGAQTSALLKAQEEAKKKAEEEAKQQATATTGGSPATTGTPAGGTGTGSGNNSGAGAPGGTIADLNILKIDCLFGGPDCLIPKLTKALVQISVPLAVLVIMWGGYQYFIGGFDGKTNGMNAIRSAIIGLIIVSMADFIVSTLSSGISGGGGGFDGIVSGVQDIIKNLRGLLVTLATSIAVLVIMWGGYRYFFSGLDWQKEGGMNAIRNGVIGLVVVFVGNGLAGTLEQVASGLQNTSSVAQVIEKLLAPLIKSFTDLLFNLAQAVAVLTIIWGGYKYFFNATEIAKKDGMDNIRNGIIGLATVYLAKSIVDLITRIIPKDGSSSNPSNLLNINITGVQSFFKFIIGDILIPASTGFAVFFAILGGYYMITAGGDDAKFKKGTKALQNATIGLIILLLSGTIINAVALIFGSGS